MKIASKFMGILENYARKKTLTQLRAMTDRQLEDCGFSRSLLHDGLEGWPWRELDEHSVSLKLDNLPGVESLPAASKDSNHDDSMDLPVQEPVLRRRAA